MSKHRYPKERLYLEDGGAMGVVVILFLGIPTIFLLYGIFMQTLSPLWLH